MCLCCVPCAYSVLEAVVVSVNWLMDHDKKVTALKQLQGRIWSEGYKRGTLLGQ